MQNNKIQVSIITVNYKVEKELIGCISSIVKSKPKVSYEIIAVDNGETNNLKRILKKEFSQVKYIKSLLNIGFGPGNNLGARYASGEYLFFLNPDTTVTDNSIDSLYSFVKNNSNAGMAAPLLFDPSGNVYPNQGSNSYDLKSAIVTNSFINKLFPNNLISKNFFHEDWNKKETEEFDVVPGTAFMIKKNIFEKAGMFDEKFFLYFEEYDLAKRIKKLGYKNYIIPKAKVLHIWGVSTKKRKDIDKIFAKSRFLFFKKHYGLFFALIVGTASSLGKYELMLSLIIALSAFLGFFRIKESMAFIGDQGWFYLSARDMLTNGNIPLVGIASSHTWLNQGPFWTYLLAFFLWMFNFNPVAGAYLTIILGILSVLGIYLVGSKLFSKRAGLIASLLYATSPLAVYYMRFPYHTSPIPLLVIALIFPLHKIINGRLNYLPLAIFLLTLLYNFEIATVVFGAVLAGVLAYKLFKKEINFMGIITKKNLILSIAAMTVPLLPMILYDIKNGFPQTLKFAAWIIYRLISFFGYNQQYGFSLNKIIAMFNFLFHNFAKLIFASDNLISLVIFTALISWIAYLIFKKKGKGSSHNLVFWLFFVPLSLIILNQTPSDAYLPMLFPITILLVSAFFDYMMNIKKMLTPILIFIIIMVFNNIYFMLNNNFAFDKNSSMFTLANRILISKEILNMAGDKDYNLKGKGETSKYESFTMNYEYLTWWLGHAPFKKNEKLKIYVSESASGIEIERISK